MNLHLYDNVERRYRHTDANQATGLAAVAHLLHLLDLPSSDGVLYDLSFYSGGIGVLDRLAVTIPADSEIWAAVAAGLNAADPEEAVHDVDWAEDFLWLVTDEEAPLPLHQAVIQFINSKRRDFQSECHSANRIFFESGSNVNDWVALWGDDSQLNYVAYSQG